MLQKRYRITKEIEFDQFFGAKFKKNSGRNLAAPILLLKVFENKLENPRFAVMISNKIDKRAVIRNRIKRQLLEIIRLNLDKFKKNVDCLLIVKPAIKEKEYGEMEKTVLELFKKIGLL